MADTNITEAMVEAAAQAAATSAGRGDLNTLGPDADYFRGIARASLRDGLAGRTVVDTPSDRLPFDARERIERALRVQGVLSGSVEGAAHRIMLALTATGSQVGEQ